MDKDVSNYYTASGYGTNADISDEIISSEPWDEFEKSLLLTIADEVKIAIRGGEVDMVVSKDFKDQEVSRP